MKNKTYYIDFNQNKWTDDGGSLVASSPELYYKSNPFLEFHFITNENGIVKDADMSDGYAWSLAVDTDFDLTTLPMVRTLDSGIDHSKAVSGIIVAELNTNTVQYYNKINGKDYVNANLELRGTDVSGNVIYSTILPVKCKGSIDADAEEPIPVQSGAVTQSWVMGVLRAGYSHHFSEDGESWHDSQTLDDKYTQTAYPGGSWSDTIMLPSGAAGQKGDAGDAATITIGTVTTLPPSSNATVQNVGTASAAILNFGIPRGPQGAGGGITQYSTLPEASSLANNTIAVYVGESNVDSWWKGDFVRTENNAWTLLNRSGLVINASTTSAVITGAYEATSLSSELADLVTYQTYPISSTPTYTLSDLSGSASIIDGHILSADTSSGDVSGTINANVIGGVTTAKTKFRFKKNTTPTPDPPGPEPTYPDSVTVEVQDYAHTIEGVYSKSSITTTIDGVSYPVYMFYDRIALYLCKCRNPNGWLMYDYRTEQEKRLTDTWIIATGYGSTLSDLPEGTETYTESLDGTLKGAYTGVVHEITMHPVTVS